MSTIKEHLEEAGPVMLVLFCEPKTAKGAEMAIHAIANELEDRCIRIAAEIHTESLRGAANQAKIAVFTAIKDEFETLATDIRDIAIVDHFHSPEEFDSVEEESSQEAIDAGDAQAASPSRLDLVTMSRVDLEALIHESVQKGLSEFAAVVASESQAHQLPEVSAIRQQKQQDKDIKTKRGRASTGTVEVPSTVGEGETNAVS